MNRPAGPVWSSGMDFLAELTNYESSGELTDPSLRRMLVLAEAVGKPQVGLPVVHVTGTNGKGSTATMAARLLSATGRRVGLFTSPHLGAVNERIVMDGEPVDDATLDRALMAVAEAAARTQVRPTWFEAITLAALLVFSESRVDAAVVEVGMLGSWDATNIVHGRVSVVTNVELDHVREAGGSRRAIAREKAGIIKEGSTLVLGEVDEALAEVFLQRPAHQVLRCNRELSVDNARETQYGSIADVRTPHSNLRDLHVGLLGRHQINNVLLAIAAVEAFVGERLSEAVVREQVSRAWLRGRGELMAIRPEVVLDGAHNPAAASALRSAVGGSRFSQRVLVVGALAGRDQHAFLEALGANTYDLVVCTEPVNPRALPATVLADAVGVGVGTVVVEPDPDRAGRIAIRSAGADGQVVVTGSMYLLEPLRHAILAELDEGDDVHPHQRVRAEPAALGS